MKVSNERLPGDKSEDNLLVIKSDYANIQL